MLLINAINFARTGGFIALNPKAGLTTQKQALEAAVVKRDEKPAHRMVLRSALLALALLCVHTIVWGQSCEPTLAKLRSGEQALIAGYSDFAPFTVVASDGRVTGMDPEIIRAITGRLGIKKVEFKMMPFSRLQPALLDKTIDVIANPFWSTPERERLYALTIPHYVRGGIGSLWVDGTGPFDSAASMAGKRIAVINGTLPEKWVLDNVPTATIIRLNGALTDLEETLANKQADVVLGMYTHEEEFAKRKVGRLAYRAHLIQPMQAVFPLRKECNELRQAFDDTLKAMWADGSLLKIKDVWLKPLGIVPAKKL